MTDEPQLPDTDDPWELLGLEPDADERAAKRAYARLIRRFRPDRSPAEFKRIRAAYDMVRDGQMFANVSFAGPASTDASPRQVARFEPAVVALPDLDALLLAGRSDDIVAALDSPVLVRASLERPELEVRVMTALCGLRWLDPVAADRLEQRYRSGFGGESHRLYAELATVQSAFDACGAASLCPKGLARYLQLGRFVGEPAWQQLAQGLAEAMTQSPTASWDALTRMFHGGAALSTYVSEAVHAWVGEADAYEHLDGDDARLLRSELWRLDKEIERRVRVREVLEVGVVVVGLVLVLVFVSRLAFALAFLAAVAWYLKGLRPKWYRHHVSIAWPALRDLMFEYGVGADALAVAIERGVDSSARLPRLAPAVARDGRWHAWSALSRATALMEERRSARDV